MRTIILIVFSSFSILLNAQEITLSYYLPQDIQYNQKIPKPKDIIGHEVGEWHVTHDKLMEYMNTLAASSNRITIENRGTTFEGRSLPLLTITSPENHKQIEKLKKEHLQLTQSDSNTLNTQNMPIVVYQGFSIHGNEPSGSNAAMAVAYYLAAAQGTAIDTLLNDVIILFDPCYNPDGLQRFSYWANTNKNFTQNPDNNEREYHEVWPGGRTNHYWFDMNRDWLPVQLPESNVRISTFHEWLPNILTDHHEMGTNSTFFFQPGEPMRVHPLTPLKNQELTKEIAKYHAKALDNLGSLYYSEEDYDDYYYGKGSTFPDINGSIGILFEQGSSRGHIQESDNGILTFPFTIKNQFTTALSTLDAAKNLKTDILNYQRNFYKSLRDEASKEKNNHIIFGDEKDGAKTAHLASILRKHKIDVYSLKDDVTINNKNYKKDYAYVVPLNQKNPRLIKAMFEKRTTFKDSIFYDISGWTFPLAFNVDYTDVSSAGYKGNSINQNIFPNGKVTQQSNYAYIFEWHEYYTPKALNAILQKGIRAKVGKTPFTVEGKKFDYGSILIPVQNQNINPEELFLFLNDVAKKSHLSITGVNTGLTQGIDLGSNDFKTIKTQKIAMLVGNGINPYDAGEIWHLLDQRYQIQLTKLDMSYLNRVDLSKYTTLIVPNIMGSIINETQKIP